MLSSENAKSKGLINHMREILVAGCMLVFALFLLASTLETEQQNHFQALYNVGYATGSSPRTGDVSLASARNRARMMGTGKGNLPQASLQQMQQMQQQQQYKKLKEEGVPYFNLYVRNSAKKSPVWFPMGAIGGDERATQAIKGWLDNSMFMGDRLKKQLDRGISESFYQNKERYVEQAVMAIKSLRNFQDDLEWGYKIMNAEDLGMTKWEEENGNQEPWLLVDPQSPEGQQLAAEANPVGSAMENVGKLFQGNK